MALGDSLSNATNAGRPLDGTVQGMTWQAFQQALGNYQQQLASSPSNNYNGGEGGGFTGGNGALVGATVPGIGDLNIESYGYSPFANTPGNDQYNADPSYNYRQQLADGTSNYFSEGPNGELLSHNETDQEDSGFQKLLDKLAPVIAAAPLFAMGGEALGGLLGSSVDASALAPGEFGLEGAGGGSFVNSAYAAGAGGAAGGSADIGSAAYDPFNPANWTASADGATATDAGANAAAGGGAAGGSSSPFYQPLLDLAKQYGFTDGPINSIANIANGTGQIGNYLSAASTANSLASTGEKLFASDGGSSDGSSSYNFLSGTQTPSSSGGNYDYLTGASPSSSYQFPTSTATPAPNPQTTNPFSALANLYNNGLTNGSASDYYQLASLLGTGASALLGSNAASTAAGQQTSAINNANALTAAIYGDTVNRNQPFVSAGTGATKTLSDLYGLNGSPAQQTAYNAFTYSPNYQTAYTQGMKGLGNAAASSGLVGSGRYLKDGAQFASGLGTQQYGAYTSGLSGLANLGQASANNTAAAGANYSNQASNLLTAGGIAQSAGTMGSTNALTNALSQLLKNSANGIYGTGG